LAMYIVISIPNRKSVACGVSHFIKDAPDAVNARSRMERAPPSFRTAPAFESGQS
jgi:hypothetical protein